MAEVKFHTDGSEPETHNSPFARPLVLISGLTLSDEKQCFSILSVPGEALNNWSMKV